MRGALRSQRAWMILGIASGVSWTAAKITVPLLAAGAIDNGIIPGDNRAIAGYALVIIAVGVLQGLSSGFRRYCAFRVAYGPRPTSASACSRTSSGCTSPSTTRRRRAS